MLDFRAITAGTDRYNFHSHTQFCDGRDTMEDFAAAAVAAGMEHYGFSPHSPVPFHTPCNMTKEQVGPFLDEVERIRRKYAGSGTRFYAAMEVDYLGDGWGPAHPYFKSLTLDYTIGSVHFLTAFTDPELMVDIDGRPERFAQYMHTYFNNDIRRVVESFYEASRNMLAAGGFDILGHLDKIGHNASHFAPGIERQEWYREVLDDFVGRVIDSGVAVEINTKALASAGRTFPGREVVARLMRAGVTLVVNSDAHYAGLIDAGRTPVLRAIR